MIHLHDYSVGGQLRSTARAQLYTAKRRRDGLAVVLKAYQQDDWGGRSRAERELELLQRIADPSVVRALEVVHGGEQPVLVLERAPGRSLACPHGGLPLDPAAFLAVAVPLAHALDSVHRARLVHRDLRPEHVLFEPRTRSVRLIEFGSAGELGSMEVPLSELSLAHVSPEQTGRMDRGVDARSDLYSLGILFYELLAGVLPFEAREPLEWIHAHLARPPVPLETRNPAVPRALARIVHRLLEKAPERRYQSAYGLGGDLELCAEQLQREGAIDPELSLGRRDAHSRLVFARKLYGRERELAELQRVYALARAGTTQALLLGGPAGVGKSALPDGLRAQVAASSGYWAHGKFDLYRREHPYAGFAAALDGLAEQLLADSEAQLERNRTALLAELGPLAAAIAELAPGFASVLGGTRAPPRIGPLETAQRLGWGVRCMLRVLARPEHPLVLFLDDLQWADAGSLKLLAEILSEERELALLVLGTYRESEVDRGHPLQLLIEDIRSAGFALRRLSVAPLAPAATLELLADVLGTSSERVQSLAERVARSAGHVPLLTQQLLTYWHDCGWIRFQPESGWEWDLAEIDAAHVPDDIGEVITGRITRLADGPRGLLQFAACVGDVFAADALAELTQASRAQIDEQLLALVGEGLLAPCRDGFRFVHDRVREAAQALWTAEQRAQLHYRTARLLGDRTPFAALPERVIEIVEHLNRGLDYVPAQSRLAIIDLNALAARRALRACGFGAAQGYLAVARSELREEDWAHRREACFSLLLQSAQCAFLNGDVATAERHLDALESRPLELLESIRVRGRRTEMYALVRSTEECVDAALAGLRMLPGRWPRNPSWLLTRWEIFRVRLALLGASPETFGRTPAFPPALHAENVLTHASGAAAFEVDSRLALLFAARAVRAMIRYGGHGVASGALAGLAHTQYAVTRNAAWAARLARLALDVDALHPDPVARYRVESLVATWLEPRHTLVESLRGSKRLLLERGEQEYANYAASWTCELMFFLGVPLAELRGELERAAVLARRSGHYPARVCEGALALLRHLEVKPADAEPLIAPAFWQTLNPLSKNMVGSMAMMIGCLWGRYGEVFALARLLEHTMRRHGGGMAHESDFLFYGGFAAAALGDRGGAGFVERWRRRRLSARAHRWLSRWARRVPENFAHQRDLLAAERARLRGRHRRALELYGAAASCAARYGYRQIAALAHERRASLLLELGLAEDAGLYLSRALELHADWGARARVAELQREHPSLVRAPAAVEGVFAPGEAAPSAETATASASAEFDLASVLRASAAISGEVQLDRVLEQIMAAALQNAGAERGLLLFVEAGSLRLAARSSLAGTTLHLREPVRVEELAAEAPLQLLQYALRSGRSVVLADAASEGLFTEDPYVRARQLRSALCLPVFRQTELVALLHLENAAVPSVFTHERVEVLNLLCTQAAISLEHARMYQELSWLNRELELRVEQRTEELRIARDAAQAATRAKSEFLATMSHEIRTPMNIVLGMTHLLAESALAENQRDWVHAVQTAGDALLSLINDILDFSRIEAGRIELEHASFSPREMIEDVAEILALKAEQKGVQLAVFVDRRIVARYFGDPARVRQIAMNFTTNAIKFTDEGEVELRLEPSGPPSRERTQTLRISVRDTGIGIPADRLSRLFESFSQVDASTTRRYGGSGLGLAISRRLAEAMGGRVGVESEAGSGSTFWCELPLALDLAKAESALLGGAAELPLCVLVRHAPSAVGLVEQLRALGAEPVHAASPAAACAWLQQSAGSGLVFLRHPIEDPAWEAELEPLFAAPRLRVVWMSFLHEQQRPPAANDGAAAQCVPWPPRRAVLAAALQRAQGGREASEPVRPAAPAQPAAPAPRGVHILVAEDYPLNQKLARTLLERAGYRCHVVCNGAEALAAVENDSFDLVLVDCQMPELDGYMFARLLRAREAVEGGHLPVIAMTANALVGDRELCLEAGMDDYLSKPIQHQKLYDLLEKHLGPRAKR